MSRNYIFILALGTVWTIQSRNIISFEKNSTFSLSTLKPSKKNEFYGKINWMRNIDVIKYKNDLKVLLEKLLMKYRIESVITSSRAWINLRGDFSNGITESVSNENLREENLYKLFRCDFLLHFLPGVTVFLDLCYTFTIPSGVSCFRSLWEFAQSSRKNVWRSIDLGGRQRKPKACFNDDCNLITLVLIHFLATIRCSFFASAAITASIGILIFRDRSSYFHWNACGQIHKKPSRTPHHSNLASVPFPSSSKFLWSQMIHLNRYICGAFLKQCINSRKLFSLQLISN